MTDQKPDVSRETSPRVLIAAYVAVIVIFCVVEHQILFAWPNGIVVGNLLASAIWAPLAIIRLERLAKLHHHQHLALLRKQHRELMFHVKRTSGKGDEA